MFDEAFAKRRVGEVLHDRYRLERLIGIGMTGSVYEATHLYTDRAVALKVMHHQLVNNDTAVKRFLREAKQVAKMGHPAIVEVVDAGETTDRWPYVVLELLEGRSLGATLREQGALPYAEVIELGLELLEGLDAAHRAGIAHRDIKPDNIFMLAPGQGGRLKILDFGIAKNLHSTGASAVLTQPGATVGTPSYMSPEQARAENVDERTDLWSAGSVLFHAATGRPPFAEQVLPALLMKLVTQRPPLLRDIAPDAPERLCRAVDGALEPKADARWPNAARMVEALRGGE